MSLRNGIKVRHKSGWKRARGKVIKSMRVCLRHYYLARRKRRNATADTTTEKKTAYAEKKKRNPTISRRQWTRRWTMKKKSIIKSCRRRKCSPTPNASNECNENAFQLDDRNNEYLEDVFEHLKRACGFTARLDSTAKKTPGSQKACVSQQTNGNNKNVAAIPIQKIAPTTAKKSPSKQLTSQQQQQHVKSSSVVKRNHQSQHRSSPQPSIDGKRKLPLTSTTTQKKKYNNTSLSPLFDEEDDNGNVNHAKPSPMNLFNNDTTNNEAANTRNANLNALMMTSPSPAKNTNNTNEDDVFDLVLPNIKATLPNTLNIAAEPGSARKNFGGAGENSTLNMETQVGYGNTALNHHHRHHHHRQST